MQYAAGRFNIGRKSLVVLHIAGIHLTCAAGGFTFEFTEQFLGRFPQYIDQHIEPAPMSHSDDNLFDSNSTGPLEGTNNKIKTLQRQAYGFRDQEYFTWRIYGLHEAKYALTG